MDTNHLDSKRPFLSRHNSSSFYKLTIVGSLFCILLVTNPYTENFTKSNQSEISEKSNIGKSNVAETFATNSAAATIQESIEKSNTAETFANNSAEATIQESIRILKHKHLKDVGPKLSARQRAKFVQERCQTFLKENRIQLDRNINYRYDHEAYMLSRRYNLSICYNCKVASTNTKRVLYALDNKFNGDINTIRQTAARAYSRIRQKSFRQILSEKQRLNVMFVREPLERLLSAYRDERSYSDHFRDPSFNFEKYLQLILEENTGNMNRHIYPYFERCRPCEIQYDFVGLQNHFNYDMKRVLQEINASDRMDIPERVKTGYSPLTSNKLLKSYFNKVPNDVVHKLWEKYYKDYYIFGFPYPSHLMN